MFTEETFLNWGQYFKVAIPTTLLCCAEWWAFEFIVIFAGTIGINEVTAQIAIINVNYAIFMLTMGI